MIKASMRLQDLRRRMYAQVKTDKAPVMAGPSAGTGGVGCKPESAASSIGLITLGVKLSGKRSAGKPPAAFEVAGVGNGLTVWLLRHSQRKRGANG